MNTRPMNAVRQDRSFHGTPQTHSRLVKTRSHKATKDTKGKWIDQDH